MLVDRYYYQQLNKYEQEVYKAFYKGVMSHEDIIPLPIRGKMSDETFDKIYAALTLDNPLIYFVNQSMCGYATDMYGRTAICPQYFYSYDKVREYNRRIEKIIGGLVGQLQLTTGSEYEKEKKIHDWMWRNVEYDFDGSDMNNPSRVVAAHNIIGVLFHHKAQCEGIAKAMKVLLNAVGVKCIVVEGDANDGKKDGPHAWNIVKIDNMPYQLDVTWDINFKSSVPSQISYNYFNVTDEIMNKAHHAFSCMPECVDTTANYFIKEGLEFKNKRQLFAYIKKSIEQGNSDFYFRIQGKTRASVVINEAANYVSSILADSGKQRMQIQKISVDDTGVCWMRFI